MHRNIRHAPFLALALVLLRAAPVDAAADAHAIPNQFAEASIPGGAPVAAPAQWWTIFNDPMLDSLVARATAGNPAIQQSAAHVSQARAMYRGTKAAQLPQIAANAGANQQTGPLINAAGGNGTLLNVGATLSYEVDLSGRLSKSARAALLDIQSREAALQSAVVSTQAATVQAYFELRGIEAELVVLTETRDADAGTLAIIEGRYGRGLTSELEVQRARGELEALATELASRTEVRAEIIHRLALLMGDAAPPVVLVAAELGSPPVIPAGIPSTVLVRRPDVAAAERGLAAAQLRLKIAKLSWLPRIALTANGGVASSALADLLKTSAQSMGIGLLLSLPLFDGGRHQAEVAGAKADLDLATADYRAQILIAFKDVEDHLARVRQTALAATSTAAARTASARAYEILLSRQANGMASSLDLLDARRTLLKAKRAEVQTRYAQFTATAGLVRALGGGWSAP